MLTNGPKYFLGLAAAAILAAVVHAVGVNPADLGGVALLGVLCAASFLAGMALFTRDGEVESREEAAEASRPAPSSSLWPLVFSLGTAATVLGMATVPAVFILGISLLVAGGAEWMVQAWAERASADGRFNTFVRERAIGAIEFPGLAALVAGVVAYPFSRIMLAISKDGATLLFIVVASLIVVVGFLVAVKPGFRGRILWATVGTGMAAVVVGGIVSGVVGEREQLAEAYREDHFSIEHRECGAEAGKYSDKHANNHVYLRSGAIATVFVEDGRIWAEAIGLDTELDIITIPRSNPVSVLFRNLDDADRRLVAYLGDEAVGEGDVVEEKRLCTQLTGRNQENVLLLTIGAPAAEGKPYTLTVPGVDGAVTMVVP